MSWYFQSAHQPSEHHRVTAIARQSQLTKPAQSLGRLEQLAITLASLQSREAPQIEEVTIHIFAADHGIAAHNISAFPQAVTGQMVQNFSAGGAAISVLARTLGAQLTITNVGTLTALTALPNVIDQRIAAGTADYLREPAMSTEQLEQALLIGRTTVPLQCDLWLGGEMGIGNTTSATTLLCALLNKTVEEAIGPGTGLDVERIEYKALLIRQALAKHHAVIAQDTPMNQHALTLLRYFGGFEIAALVHLPVSMHMQPLDFDIQNDND